MDEWDTPGELWADLFMNWTYGSFVNNIKGNYLNNWMSSNMPNWLSKAF